MKPASPVIPTAEFNETKVAEHQEDFQTLPAIKLENNVILCRWHMSDEERKIVAETGDIYLLQWTDGAGVTPMLLQVEAPELHTPEPQPLPQMMKVPRRSSHILNEAKRHNFEIFDDNCSECSHVVVYTGATKETLLESPEIKVVCAVCFNQMQVENPELTCVFHENTHGEIRQIKEVMEINSAKDETNAPAS